MPTDPSGLVDDVVLEMNGEVVPTNNLPPLKRPADNASLSKWVDYCVDLGADRDFLLGKTQHYVDNPETPDAEFTESEKATKADLRELADRLGG